jgi:hypothetical protein
MLARVHLGPDSDRIRYVKDYREALRLAAELARQAPGRG